MSKKIKITVDAVVFGYDQESGIRILLVKRKYEPFKGEWALPGGFILESENLEDAVERELYEETGVRINYLEQLYTFGKVDRDPRSRIISVAYFGLVNSNHYKDIRADTDAEDVDWIKIKDLPSLAFDHKVIIEKAVDRLRSKVRYEPIGFELLDSKFPFSDLEDLYGSLLDKPIDRRNFKKKFMSFGILTELNEFAPKKGAGRPGKLYQFDEAKYKARKENGLFFEI